MAVEQGGIPEPESQEGATPKTSDKLAPLLGFLALIIFCVTLVSFIIPRRTTIAFWIFLVLNIEKHNLSFHQVKALISILHIEKFYQFQYQILVFLRDLTRYVSTYLFLLTIHYYYFPFFQGMHF